MTSAVMDTVLSVVFYVVVGGLALFGLALVLIPLIVMFAEAWKTDRWKGLAMVVVLLPFVLFWFYGWVPWR